MLVIIDAKPKDLGLPTDAYVAVEEVHDVRHQISMCNIVKKFCEEKKYASIFSQNTRMRQN